MQWSKPTELYRTMSTSEETTAKQNSANHIQKGSSGLRDGEVATTKLSANAPEYVQALWSFKGQEKGDLSFRSGDILKIKAANHVAWWEASLFKTRDYRKVKDTDVGIIPCNYVTAISEEQALTCEPLMELKKHSSKRKEVTQPTTLSFHARESINSIAVTAAERKLISKDPIEIRSLYKVEVLLNRLRVVERRYHEFLELDSQLRELCPGLEVDVDLRRRELMTSKKTAYTMELRRKALQDYLQKAVQNSNAGALILTFLFPKSPVTAQPSGRNLLAASGESRGSSKHNMKVDVDAEVKEPDDPFVSPPTPSSSRKFALAIDDIAVFDDLIDYGYAIMQSDSIPEEAEYPEDGDKVIASFRTLIWDGSRESAAEIDKRDACMFTINSTARSTGYVGEDYKYQLFVPIPRGLSLALQRVPVGVNATIVISPEVAFGMNGLPPTIPQATHVVYRIKLVSIEEKASISPEEQEAEGESKEVRIAHHQGRAKKRVELEQSKAPTMTPEINNAPEGYVRIAGQVVPADEAHAMIDQMMPQLQRQGLETQK